MKELDGSNILWSSNADAEGIAIKSIAISSR
jgi:hypothetical protein